MGGKKLMLISQLQPWFNNGYDFFFLLQIQSGHNFEMAEQSYYASSIIGPGILRVGMKTTVSHCSYEKISYIVLVYYDNFR